MPQPTAAASVKLFVLDTNVILHDSDCIRNFEENDIAIPITVIEELDKFKKGHEDVNYHARAFLRRLDEIAGDVLSDRGAALGEGLGTIRVAIGGGRDERLLTALSQDSPDHRILNTALGLQKHETERRVILVSKDTNLRIKAKSLGLPAEDYSSDKVESFDKLYTGKRTLTDLPGETIDAFYTGGEVSVTAFPGLRAPLANENLPVQRAELPDQPDDEPAALCSHHVGKRGAVRAGRLGKRSALRESDLSVLEFLTGH